MKTILSIAAAAALALVGYAVLVPMLQAAPLWTLAALAATAAAGAAVAVVVARK
jgi:hypothetical protein